MKKKLCTCTFVLAVFLTNHVSAQRLFHLMTKTQNKSTNLTSSSKSTPTSTPTITSITLTANNSVVITGTNLLKVTAVKFGSVLAASVDNSGAPTQIIAIPQSGSSVNDQITVTTGYGDVSFSSTATPKSSSGFGAAGDLTLPDLSQSGLNVIVTPTFSYNQIYQDSRFGFSGSTWGNTATTDSLRAKAGSNFLLPESSVFGFKLEGTFILNPKQTVNVGIDAEANFLAKKVSFLDTTSKTTTNFNPFVIQPKIGLTVAAFHGAILGSAYINMLAVETDNDNFSKFFNTANKNVFIYPEFKISGTINLSSTSTQALDIGFDITPNNSTVRMISSSTDKSIVYIRVGFVSPIK